MNYLPCRFLFKYFKISSNTKEKKIWWFSLRNVSTPESWVGVIVTDSHDWGSLKYWRYKNWSLTDRGLFWIWINFCSCPFLNYRHFFSISQNAVSDEFVTFSCTAFWQTSPPIMLRKGFAAMDSQLWVAPNAITPIHGPSWPPYWPEERQTPAWRGWAMSSQILALNCEPRPRDHDH